ncbi:hypothetical protein [Candidatus Cardinium sp. cBcalN2]|uniref:hypothetical protein n=1 Tax=Candidatus Cardinium sp. cBcalN2 TaxID=2699436 RepID=UPI001FB1F76D|nr:hypothetical protein [Candidatus Cardinium sp. cBcalN2]
MVKVALSSPYLNKFYLNSFIYPIEDKTIPYRFDLFGGNRMKCPTETVQDLINHKTRSFFGYLLAVPFSELNTHSAFGHFLSRLFPNKESFFYFQRALLARPMKIPGRTDQKDAVLEGKFRIKIYRDYDAKVCHPFRLNNNLQLRPHDGCGFIKSDLAAKLGLAIGQKVSYKKSFSYLPAQALQHYSLEAGASTQALQQELAQNLAEEIKDLDQLAKEAVGNRLFHLLTSGCVKGKSFIALPSADGQVHGTDLGGPLLIGRAPYDQPNLCLMDQVGKPTDATTVFLEQQAHVIQYSLVAQDNQDTLNSKQLPDADRALWFAKGLLVVIPDQAWPAGLDQVDIVLSAADIKTHSRWKNAQEKQIFKDNIKDDIVEVGGILLAIKAYQPSECIALPIEKQTYLSGDFDGDNLLVIDAKKRYPALYNFLKQKDDAKAHPLSNKFAKTFTPAFKADTTYSFGRAKQILDSKSNVLELFSSLQTRFLALDLTKRKDMEHRVMAEMQKETEEISKVSTLAGERLDLLLSLGIKVGTDAYKSATDVENYFALAKILNRTFEQEGVPPAVPYGKSLARRMGKRQVSIDALQNELAKNPTLAALYMASVLNEMKSKNILNPFLNAHS